MGFNFSKTDNIFWYKQDKTPNETVYYSYNLLYVDDILIVLHDPHKYMNHLKVVYRVKQDSTGELKL